MEQQKIRIKLKAFDHKLVDKSTKETTSFDLNSVSEKSNKSANKRPTKKDRRILDKIVAKTLE